MLHLKLQQYMYKCVKIGNKLAIILLYAYFVFCASLVLLLSLYCVHCIGQQSVLLALLSCSSCSVKLHICSVI